jgi:hypothetical protein
MRPLATTGPEGPAIAKAKAGPALFPGQAPADFRLKSGTSIPSAVARAIW